jgi:Flp pilus assembly pilin Flp
MIYPSLLRRFTRHQQGATAVEFAIVSGAFFLLLMGVIEFGLIMLTKVAIESATTQVSRSGSIGSIVPGCPDRVCSIKKLVEEKTYGLVARNSVVVTAKFVSRPGLGPSAGSPPVPDICLADINNPYPATCTTVGYQDNNSDGDYDPPPDLLPTSIGQAGDVIEIRVTYLWRILFPLFRNYFGPNGVLTITTSTVVKNEPYGVLP